MANRLFELNETKGTFKIRGIVTEIDRDNSYSDKKTKTGKARRQLSFGLQYKKDEVLYVNCEGMEKDTVWFSRRKDDGTTETKQVKWADRYSFKEDGFAPIGVVVALETTHPDQSGKSSLVYKRLDQFDACKYIKDILEDDTSVEVKGRIEYSSYETDKGEKRNNIKLQITNITRCRYDLDLDETTEENAVHDFEQTIMFMGAEKEEKDGTPTNRAIISANIVNYNSIETAEFIIEDLKDDDLSAYCRNLRKLDPYTSITISGKIYGKAVEEEISDNDGWGKPNPMRKVSRPYVREFLTSGAESSSIDQTLYNEQSVNEAIEKINNSKKADRDFGDIPIASSSNDGWGTTSKIDFDDEEDDW